MADPLIRGALRSLAQPELKTGLNSQERRNQIKREEVRVKIFRSKLTLS